MESMWESMGAKSRENEILFEDLKQTTQLTIHMAIRGNPTYTKIGLFMD